MLLEALAKRTFKKMMIADKTDDYQGIDQAGREFEEWIASNFTDGRLNKNATVEEE